jgi:hypothetical protein
VAAVLVSGSVVLMLHRVVDVAGVVAVLRHTRCNTQVQANNVE